MPLNVITQIERDGSTQEIRQTMDRGTYGLLEDFTDGFWRLLVVHCLEDDTGGEIYEVTDPRALESPEKNPDFFTDYCTLESLLTLIPRFRSYHREALMETRQQASYHITHVLSGKFTADM